MTGWYLHLGVIHSGLGEVEKDGRRQRRGEEREKLLAISEPDLWRFRSCFPRVPHFHISYQPSLKCGTFCFYMSFACSSSKLPPSSVYAAVRDALLPPWNCLALLHLLLAEETKICAGQVVVTCTLKGLCGFFWDSHSNLFVVEGASDPPPPLPPRKKPGDGMRDGTRDRSSGGGVRLGTRR